MKLSIILLFVFAILLNFSSCQGNGQNNNNNQNQTQHAGNNQQQPPPPMPYQPSLKPNPNYPGRDRCDQKSCQSCYYQICIKCNEDYYLTDDYYCNSRDDFEDRGDGYSQAVGIINIIFLIVVHHGWTIISRKNLNKYLQSQQNQEPQLNQQALQMLQQQNNIQNNNGQNSPQLLKIGAPSEFDTVSKKSAFEPNIYDEKNNIFGYNQNQASKIPNFDIDNNNNNGAHSNIVSGYPISQNQGQFQTNFVPQFQPQQQIQQQQSLQQPQGQQKQDTQQIIVTSDLNGYWLTQAGKFSFPLFSNFHRIKHVTINLIILQRTMSSMIYWAGSRGDDDDTDERKELLFLAFLGCMIMYWLFTFIPALVLKIFSFCFCLKQDPNGMCSARFIAIIFYGTSFLMTVVTTSVLFMMTGFEAQVWILLCLAAWLIIVFFDKKSVEYAKKNRGGFLEGIIKFRKIDFSIPQSPQQIQQNANQIQN
ncbi:transmembrane protein, putative (macronuclear) [Tetrahymena thermophila SB210]|uniref:Transmembrane protein, putative n=1 Tax=Tetrahymena thermophila (strain SB210) TaxID=312017 RepID=Q22P95_TETTS|nr:transmembrane protein, putative [Tetrahymena thermophila SB210]EAR87214.2 transmembrane protein, putative [Tetrahymena thermophila SB210]|eukprot:XP_001007459.2 transmembrane protein, putative [Tetrahymena thermophila SB210]